MVQFNLLPDLKVQYIRAKRLKRTVMLLSVLVAASALAIFILLYTAVDIFQKVQINNLSKSITKDSSTLTSSPDLNKILTIQNQLNTLPSLEGQNPVTSRIFNYIGQITPAKATISSLGLDFSTSGMTITGEADNIVTINTFVDTLKFTNYSYSNASGTPTTAPAFNSVVLSSYSDDKSGSSYSISLKFNGDLFDSSKAVSLSVPKQVTTRSQLEQPTDIFKANPVPGH